MKRLSSIICFILFVMCSSCASGTELNTTANDSKIGETMNITLTIGTKTFDATISDSQAARALVSKFPLTVDMSELNGNEYYVYLNGSLPTESKNPRVITAGDLKLFGANCLVIFYKSFNTSYSYTNLGTISDAKNLLAALKASGGKVTFSFSEVETKN